MKKQPTIILLIVKLAIIQAEAKASIFPEAVVMWQERPISGLPRFSHAEHQLIFLAMMTMHMRVDLSSRVQAMEDLVREKAATSSVSPSTSKADLRRSRFTITHPLPPGAKPFQIREGESGQEASIAAYHKSHDHRWGLFYGGGAAQVC